MGTQWQKAIPKGYSLKGIKNAVHVDLGCGNLPRNPLDAERVIGVDVSSTPPYKVISQSLEYVQVFPGLALPFESNQIDSVSAFDFLEHIPRSDRTPKGDFSNPFIEIMNEIYRILKPGGLFISLTPCFPSPAAFTDPTHVNFISDTSHLYFSGPNFAKVKNYGFIGEFDLVEAAWSDWSGFLWNAYAIRESSVTMSLKIKLYFKFFKLLRQVKASARKRLFGHSGETHFLWVFQKPVNSD